MTLGDVNYLGSTGLGKIKQWAFKKAGTITPISFPGENSGLTEGVDTLGIIAYLNFRGRFTGNFVTIQDAIHNINAILDGRQISSTVLYSPFVNSRDATNTRRQGSQGVTTSSTADKLKDTTASWNISGVQIGDKVKNLDTGDVALVNDIDSNTQLAIDDDIFQNTGESYAVSANINVKVLKFDTRWGLPGLSWCDYELNVMQVK